MFRGLSFTSASFAATAFWSAKISLFVPLVLSLFCALALLFERVTPPPDVGVAPIRTDGSCPQTSSLHAATVNKQPARFHARNDHRTDVALNLVESVLESPAPCRGIELAAFFMPREGGSAAEARL